MEKVKIPKIFDPPRTARISGPVFSGPGQKLKIPLPTFFLPRPLVSEMVRHVPAGPKPQEEIDFPKNPFFRVRVTRPKITLREYGRP